MTTGERIAQKRKEQGLSQEALGDQLSVSRQAIYKWESDAALPEIEKLIALSRLFGVSVGWLLGVEESPASEQSPSPQHDELSETQLKMVKEIVEQYLASQPKPSHRRKWLWVLLGFAILFYIFSFIYRLDQIDQQYHRVQMTVSQVQDSVNAQVTSISERVEEILKSQNSLTAEYGTELLSADLSRNTVTFSLRAVPKTYTEGMTAVFAADCGSGSTEFPASLSAGNAFTGDITVELTDSITLSAVFIGADGTRQTQLLDTFEGLFSASLPVLDIQAMYLMHVPVVNGSLTLENEYITVRESESVKSLGTTAAQISGIKLGVFRNQKLLGWAVPCEQPATFHGDFEGRQFYRLPDLTIEQLTESDKLFVAALVTDSYGRQFMACDIPFVVEFEDDTHTAGYLTYPSDGRYDNDPDNWIFS